MHLVTANGAHKQIKARASGFLTGSLDSFGDVVRMAELPSGLGQTATYYQIYRSNPWVYAAVNAIAPSLARMPLKLYRFTNSAGDRERVRGDVPLHTGRMSDGEHLDAVLRRPIPGHGRKWVLKRQLTDLLIRGNGLMRKEYEGSTGRLRWLHHTPWRTVQVHLTNDETQVLFYEIWSGGTSTRLMPEDVVHLSIGNDPDRPIGLSPIASLSSTVALYNAMMRHLLGFMKNQARPSGHLKFEKGATPELLDKVREYIKQMYANPDKAGEVLLSTGEWQQITESAEHSQILQLIRNSREEVAAGYGIAPPLMGILDRAIMGNVRELRTHHLRETVGSWAGLVEDELDAQLLGDTPALAHHFLEFDLAEALRPDMEVRARAMRSFQNTYSLNERRARENLPPIDHPDADAVWMDLNQTPIGSETSSEPDEEAESERERWASWARNEGLEELAEWIETHRPAPEGHEGNGHEEREAVRVASP